MSWATIAAQHVSTPVVLVSITFNSGTRYYSTGYIRTATRCYKGNIVDLPQIRTSIGDIKRTYERGAITIIFNDSDYEFRGLETTETVAFKNRTVTVALAFADDDYATSTTVYTGKVYSWRKLDGMRYEFNVIENARILDDLAPDCVITKSDFPNAHVSCVGLLIPIWYGNINSQGVTNDGAYGHPALEDGTGLPFIDTTQDAERHLVGTDYLADPDPAAIARVYKNGVLQTAGADYNLSTYHDAANRISTSYGGSSGYVYYATINWIAGNRPTETDRISCDIYLYAGSGTPVSYIRHFLVYFCGYPGAGIWNDVSYFAELAKQLARGWEYHGVVWEQKSVRSWFDEWRDDWGTDIYWDKDGNICFHSDHVYSATAPNHYKDHVDILGTYDSRPTSDSNVMNWLRGGYNYHFSKNYFQAYTNEQDAYSQTKYGSKYREFKSYMFIRSKAMAEDVSARRVMRFAEPPVFETYRLPLKTFSDNLTDEIKITDFRGTGAAGYDGSRFIVRGQMFDLDNYTNEMIAEYVDPLAGNGFILGDGTILPAAWTGATLAQKHYGYLCDGTTDTFSDGMRGKKLSD